jgi:hypothetical protein
VGINIRQKGQTGEREVADMLNSIIYNVMKELDFPEEECLKSIRTVQRNQNQSAVGGNDLTNCFGLSIEVKRQEQLAVATWWKQCLASAERNSEMPVLIYRQNRKPWRIRTYGWINISSAKHLQAIVEIDIDTFKNWFRERVKHELINSL